jgi:hypothetical protein
MHSSTTIFRRGITVRVMSIDITSMNLSQPDLDTTYPIMICPIAAPRLPLPSIIPATVDYDR